MALIVFLAFVIAIPWMAMNAPGMLMLGLWTVVGIVLLAGLVTLIGQYENRGNNGHR